MSAGRDGGAPHTPGAAAAAGLAGLSALLAPALAEACPYCATRSAGGIGQSIALGVFLLLPFVVAGVVYSVLRREAE
jgi:hypothetical protein